MTQQATTIVEASEQEAEAKVQQEPETAQTRASTAVACAIRGTTAGQPDATELLATAVAQPGIKTLESQARTEQLGDIQTVAESSAVPTLMPDAKILCVVHRAGVEEVHQIHPSYACLLVD